MIVSYNIIILIELFFLHKCFEGPLNYEDQTEWPGVCSKGKYQSPINLPLKEDCEHSHDIIKVTSINYNPINDSYVFYFDTNQFTKIEIPLIPKLFGHKVICANNKVYIIGGMDNFKYVGDENLIYKPEKEGDEIFNNLEEELQFSPMDQIFEMELKI